MNQFITLTIFIITKLKRNFPMLGIVRYVTKSFLSTFTKEKCLCKLSNLLLDKWPIVKYHKASWGLKVDLSWAWDKFLLAWCEVYMVAR